MTDTLEKCEASLRDVADWLHGSVKRDEAGAVQSSLDHEMALHALRLEQVADFVAALRKQEAVAWQFLGDSILDGPFPTAKWKECADPEAAKAAGYEVRPVFASPVPAPAAVEDERERRLAVALNTIIHSSNHCGSEHTHFSPTALMVIREIEDDIKSVLGYVAGATPQYRDPFGSGNGALSAQQVPEGWKLVPEGVLTGLKLKLERISWNTSLNPRQEAAEALDSWRHATLAAAPPPASHNDQRQARKDSQGPGEPSHLPPMQPAAGAEATPAEELANSVGKAFFNVLRDPNTRWRDTGAQLFIDRVANEVGTALALADTAQPAADEPVAWAVYEGAVLHYIGPKRECEDWLKYAPDRRRIAPLYTRPQPAPDLAVSTLKAIHALRPSQGKEIGKESAMLIFKMTDAALASLGEQG